MGLPAVAAWWLAIVRFDEDEDTEAAATPTRTMERAKIRMASFTFSNPFGFELVKASASPLLYSSMEMLLSLVFS
jgi:hypothetical protein